jgi:hypothetical protein
MVVKRIERGGQVPSNTTSFNYKQINLRATCFDIYQSSSGPNELFYTEF